MFAVQIIPNHSPQVLRHKVYRSQTPVYLLYLAGTADERQYRVTDRKSWFRIVMGQEEVARIIPSEEEGMALLPPRAFQEDLVFALGIE